MKKYEEKYRFVERATKENGGAVRRSKLCGCINCGNIFFAEKAVFPHVGDGERDTVLCPHCMCDAVIPDAAGASIDKYTLRRLARAFYYYRDDDPEYRKKADDTLKAVFGAIPLTLDPDGDGKIEKSVGDDAAVSELPGRAPKTTAEDLFVEAMLAKRWDVVLQLVGSGLRPGEVRHHDVGECLSALGLALEDGEFEVAEKLYAAGDRLDDYCRHTGPDMKFSLLSFLSCLRRGGKDPFYDEFASLTTCCGKGLLLQGALQLDAVSRSELDRAAAALLDEGLLTAVFSFGYPDVIDFLRRIFERGGRLSAQAGAEALERIGRLENIPEAAWWRIDSENAALLRALIEKYTAEADK